MPDERYTVPFGEARVHREETTSRSSPGAPWSTRPTRPPSSSRARRLGRDPRPADDHSLGQGGRAPLRREDVEGRRPARGHAHRRLRRRDRGHDRRGGLRAPRCAGEADRAPDTPVPFSPPLEKRFIPQVEDVVAGLEGPRGVLRSRGHRNRRRRRDAPDGRVRLGGHDHEVAQVRGRGDRGRRGAPRDLDRQGRHRGPSPASGVVTQILVQEGETVDVGARLAVISPEGGAEELRPPRRFPSRRPRRPRASRPTPAAPRARPRPPSPAPAPEPAAEPRPGAGPAGCAAPRTRSAPTGRRRERRRRRARVRLAGGRAHRVRARRRRLEVDGSGRGGRVTKKDILAYVESGGAKEEPRRGCRAGGARGSAPPAAPCRARRAAKGGRAGARSHGSRAAGGRAARAADRDAAGSPSTCGAPSTPPRTSPRRSRSTCRRSSGSAKA